MVRITAEVTSLATDSIDVLLVDGQLATALKGAKFLCIDIGDVVIDTALEADPELPEHKFWHCDVEVS